MAHRFLSNCASNVSAGSGARDEKIRVSIRKFQKPKGEIMKRKIALLLAVIMAFSMIPMSVFGARAGSILDIRPTPPYSVVSYTFRLDAEALSRWQTGTESAGLQFTARGGADAWSAGFVAPYNVTTSEFRRLRDWANDPLPNDRQLNPVIFTVTAGPNFMVDGDGSSGAVAPILQRIEETMNGIQPGGTSNQWFTVDGVDASPSQLLDNTFGRAHRRLTVAFPPISERLTGWLHITMADDDLSWVTTTVADEEQTDANAVWIANGLFVATEEAEVEVRLVSGVGRETVLLPFNTVSAGASDGVSITSPVVPMGHVAALPGIRIEELRPQGAMTLPVISSIRPNHDNYYVRLVAPRGYVWETGTLTGIAPQTLRAEFNSDVFVGGDVVFTGSSITAGASFRHFENPSTSRDELILTIPHRVRRTDVAASNTRGRITIRGLTIIPVRGTTAGDVAVDVYFGRDRGSSTFLGETVDTIGHMNTSMQEPGRIVPGTNEAHLNAPKGNAPFTATPFWRENFWAESWRNRGLVVANHDTDAALIVTGPATVPSLVSGELSVKGNWEGELEDRVFVPENSGTNARWVNAAEHTIRIEEVMSGNMLRGIDRFEIVPVNDGVKIVDAQVRVGYASDRTSDRTGNVGRGYAWTNVLTDTARFLTGLSTFDGGNSLQFAPRTLDLAGTPAGQERLSGVNRSLDIRMLYSIQAGYEGKHGSDVEFEVFRNGVSIGTVKVATVTDKIIVETIGTPTQIVRNALDLLALTPVSGFKITETAVGNLEFGDVLYFSLAATQDGRPIEISNDMVLHLGAPTIDDESDMAVRRLGAQAGQELSRGRTIAYEIRRESTGTPGVITFPEAYVVGSVRPGIDWHVVVSGPNIAINNVMYADSNIAVVEAYGIPEVDYSGQGANRTAVTSTDQRRARFYDMPYSAVVLEVRGTAVIDPGNVTQGPGLGLGQVVSLREGDMVDVNGTQIQAIILHRSAVDPNVAFTMINPRVFAHLFGLNIGDGFDPETRSFTFTGPSALSPQTSATLTLDNPNIVVNGTPHDIATRAGQPRFAGTLSPVVQNDRQYVPARVLANIFGIRIGFSGGTVTLG
jgi:hypothetical protein